MTRTQRVIVAGVGVALLVVGVLLLFVWEFETFRATTFDRDFTGAECGTPLDNPGWRTGSPCHGAVNRQTGAAWLLTFSGLGTLVLAAVGPRPRSSTA